MSGRVLGRAVLSLEADSRPMERDIDQARDVAESRLGGLGSRLKTLGTAAFASFGIGAVGSVAAVLTSFQSLESGINQVFTLLPDASEEAMAEMTGQVKDFAREFGVLPDEVIPGLYDALGAGVPKENVFAFMEVAQKAAIGGATELGTAVDGLTTVVNAFGADTISAQEASDILFQTINLGKGTMDEMARSMSNVTPIAAAMGVSFSDIGAALAALTAQGVPTSVATTQLRAVMSELGKEGTVVADIFREQTGQSFQQFIQEGGNLQTALQALEAHAGEAGISMIDMFGSIEAGQAALALTGRGTEAFTEAMETMQNSAGATDEAYRRMDRGVGRSIQRLRASFAVLTADLGALVAPAVQFVVDYIIETGIPALYNLAGLLQDTLTPAWVFVRDAFVTFRQAIEGDWMPNDEIRTGHLVVGRFATGLRDLWERAQPVVSTLRNFGTSVSLIVRSLRGSRVPLEEWEASFFELSPILRAAANAVGRIIANFGDFLTVLNPLAAVVRRFVSVLGRRGLGGAIEDLPDNIADVVRAFRNVGDILLNEVIIPLGGQILEQLRGVDWAGIGSEALGLLRDGVTGAFDILGGVWDTLSGAVLDVDWEAVGADILGLIQTGIEAVGSFAGDVGGWIYDQIVGFDYAGAGESILGVLAQGAKGVTGFAADVGGWIGEQISGFDYKDTATDLVGAIESGIEAVTGFGTRFYDWASGQIEDVDWAGTGGTILGGIRDGITAVTDFGTVVGGWLSDTFGGVDYSGAAQAIVDGVARFVRFETGVADALASTIEGFDWSRAAGGVETGLNTTLAGIDFSPIGEALGQFLNIFGPMISDAVASIRVGLADLQPVLDELGPLFDALVEAGRALLPVAGALAGIVGAGLVLAFRAFADTFRVVAAVLGPTLVFVIRSAVLILQGFTDSINTLVDVVTTAVGVVSDLLDGDFRGAWDGVREIVGEVVDLWFRQFERLTEFPGMMLEAVEGILTNLDILPEDGFGAISTFVTDGIAELGRLPGAGVQAVSDFVAGGLGALDGLITDGLNKAAEAVGGILGEAGRLVTEGVQRFLDFTTGAGGHLLDFVTEAATSAASILTAILSGLAGLIGDAPGQGVGLFVSFVTGAGGKIIDWTTDTLPGLMLDIITGVVSGLANLTGTGEGGGLQPFVDFVTDVGAKMLELVGSMYQVGVDIVQGIINGITDKAKDLPGVITSNIVDAVKNPLDLGFLRSSPSQWMYDLAADLIAGFAIGIDTERSEAIEATVRLVTGIADALMSLHDLAAIAPQAGTVDIAGINAFVADLKQVAEFAVRSFGESAAAMSGDFRDAALGFANAVEASFGALLGAFEFTQAALAGDAFDFDAMLDLIRSLKFLADEAVGSLAESAAVMEAGAAPSAAEFAGATEATFDGLLAALDFIQSMRDVSNLLDRSMGAVSTAAGRLATLAVGIVSEFGRLVSGWTGQLNPTIALFSEAASQTFGGLSDTLGFVLDVTEASDLLASASFDLAGLGRRLVDVARQITQVFGFAALHWDGGVNEEVRAFADATGDTTAALSDTLDFVREAGNPLELSVAGVQRISRLASDLAHIALLVGRAFADAALRWDGTVNPAVTLFADGAGEATGALADILGFVRDATEPLDLSVEGVVAISRLARDLADIAFLVATGFAGAAGRWDGSVNPAITTFADAASTSVGTLSDVLGFVQAASEGVTTFDPDRLVGLGAALADLGAALASEVSRAAGEWRGTVSGAFRDFVDASGGAISVVTGVLDFIRQVAEGNATDADGNRIFTIPSTTGLAGRLVAIATTIVDAVEQAAAEFEGRSLEPAQAWALAVGDLLSFFTAISDTFTALADSTNVTKNDTLRFERNLGNVFDLLERVGTDAGGHVDVAEQFRDDAIAIADAIKAGVLALTSLGGIPGVDISLPGGEIPAFGTGSAFVDRPTIAVVGDRDEFILTPDQLRTSIGALIRPGDGDFRSGAGGQATTVVVRNEIRGRVIDELIVDENRSRTRRTYR